MQQLLIKISDSSLADQSEISQTFLEKSFLPPAILQQPNFFLSKESARWGKLSSHFCISIYNIIFCIFSHIIFLIWIETVFDEFLIAQIVLISIGNEPKGVWLVMVALESRRTMVGITPISRDWTHRDGRNNNNTWGKRVWGFPMTLSKKKIQSIRFIILEFECPEHSVG